jgi:hypothetical protein
MIPGIALNGLHDPRIDFARNMDFLYPAGISQFPQLRSQIPWYLAKYFLNS